MSLTRLFGIGVVMVVAALFTGVVLAQSPAQGTSQVQEDEFLKGAYSKDTPGLTLPKVKHFVPPKYTPDAMRAKIQGQVEVQAVVMPDGTVGRARILQSLDKVFGLDEQALIAAKQWTFEPGRLGEDAVPVVVSFHLEFKLH